MGRHRRAGAALKSMQHELAESPPCAVCGQRLGKHRFGDDACPNPRWQPGNGQSQWLTSSYTKSPTANLPWQQQQEVEA